MTDAVIEQIRFWHKTCIAYEKCIKRRNKRINSLQHENIELRSEVNKLMLRLAEADNEAN